MATTSLSNFSSFVNQQIELQENMRNHLSKAQALIQVIMKSISLGDFSGKILHDYLWALNDMVEDAFELSESSLGKLLDESNGSCVLA